MSKSLSITLPNAVADTLTRHMATLDMNLPVGMRSSKSNYIANSLKLALEKDGLEILSNTGQPYQYIEQPNVPPRIVSINPNPPL